MFVRRRYHRGREKRIAGSDEEQGPIDLKESEAQAGRGRGVIDLGGAHGCSAPGGFWQVGPVDVRNYQAPKQLDLQTETTRQGRPSIRTFSPLLWVGRDPFRSIKRKIRLVTRTPCHPSR